MILQRLLLENFKQYASLDLAFREGLIGIIGKNGSGKSSIFDGILLCLFGSAVSTDKAFYKTSWAGKKDNVRLELWLEVAGKQYRILREFRGKALAPYAGIYDYEDKQLATGATAVNQEVSRLIGMDKDAFTRSIFSGQKELGILSNTRGEERKKMVRKMIGLDNLDQIQKLVREDRNNLKRAVEGQKALLLGTDDLKSIQAEIKELNKENKALQKSLDSDQKKLEKKNKAYQTAKKAFNAQLAAFETFNLRKQEETKYLSLLDGIQADSERLKRELADLKLLEKDQQKLKKPVGNYLKELDNLTSLEGERNKFQELQTLKSQREDYIERIQVIKTDIEQLKNSTKEHKKLEKGLADLTPKIEAQQKNKDLQSKELQKLSEARGKILGSITDRKNQLSTITELGADAECPTCLQPLVNAYQKTVEKLNKEIADYEETQLKSLDQQTKTNEESIEKLDLLINKLTEEKQNFSLAINKIEDQLKRLSQAEERLAKGEKMIKDKEIQIKGYANLKFDQKEYDSLKEKIETFKPTYLTYQINEDKLKNSAAIKEQLAKNKTRISDGQAKIKTVIAAIKASGYVPEKYQAAQIKQDELEAERDQLQKAVQELVRQQRVLENQITTRQQRIETDEANRSTIAENLVEFEELETLDGLFKAFKTFILDKIKPTITDYAGTLFEKITKGRYESIHVDDNFDFQIFENGTAYPISRFSGGEVDLANLCLRIGISKAIAELSGSTEALSFLGFDEIFGSQDEDRRMEILLALEHLKEQYRQIYIITHVDTVKDYFPNILQVTQSGKGSAAAFQ